MITESQIQALCNEHLAGTTRYALSVVVRPGNRIVVELEDAGPVNIDHCVALSRHIESSLDRETEDFSLDVSSPGLDKPLRDPRQFIKNVGRTLQVTLPDGSQCEGVLHAADGESFTIHETKKVKDPQTKKNTLQTTVHNWGYSAVKQAKLVITFNS